MAGGGGGGVRLGSQALEKGQREGRRLARARLGTGHDIPSIQDDRDRLGLDGGGDFVALLAYSAQQLG